MINVEILYQPDLSNLTWCELSKQLDIIKLERNLWFMASHILEKCTKFATIAVIFLMNAEDTKTRLIGLIPTTK